MSLKHSPVPWTRPSWERCAIYRGTQKVAHVNINTLHYEGNAALLNAAPELLEALEILSGHIDHLVNFPEVLALEPGMKISLEQARQAILAARGEA